LRGDYALHRPVVNAYLVRERDRKRLRELALVTLLVLPLGLGLLADIWIHMRVIEAGYRLNQLERSLRELERQERRLRLEASYLASPQRVEALAVEQLGMIEPAPEQMLFVEGER
jgi:cell division protein FtsL